MSTATDLTDPNNGNRKEALCESHWPGMVRS